MVYVFVIGLVTSRLVIVRRYLCFLKVGLDLEAIKVGMNYPDGNDADLNTGVPDQRAPSQNLVKLSNL